MLCNDIKRVWGRGCIFNQSSSVSSKLFKMWTLLSSMVSNFAKHTILLFLAWYVNKSILIPSLFLIFSFISSPCWPNCYLDSVVSSTGKHTISCTLTKVCYLTWFHSPRTHPVAPVLDQSIFAWQVTRH